MNSNRLLHLFLLFILIYLHQASIELTISLNLLPLSSKFLNISKLALAGDKITTSPTEAKR